MLRPSAIPSQLRLELPNFSIYTSNAAAMPLSPRANMTTHSPSRPAFSTCRALQALLQTAVAPRSHSISACSLHNSNNRSSLASPIHMTTPSFPSQQPTQNLKSSTSTSKPNQSRTNQLPRTNASKPLPPSYTSTSTSTLKRKRSLSDASQDQENLPQKSDPSTPKRTRIHPPTLPRGLHERDFDALRTSRPYSSPPSRPRILSSTLTPSPVKQRPSSRFSITPSPAIVNERPSSRFSEACPSSASTHRTASESPLQPVTPTYAQVLVYGDKAALGEGEVERIRMRELCFAE